jgi:hypothetical protein
MVWRNRVQDSVRSIVCSAWREPRSFLLRYVVPTPIKYGLNQGRQSSAPDFLACLAGGQRGAISPMGQTT